MQFLKKMYMLFRNDDSELNIYLRRKIAFIANMDDRQLNMLKLYQQNASNTEVHFTLEKRVFDLEQELIALKDQKNEV